MNNNDNLTRFLLTFFLGWIGSLIINNSTLKPEGYRSRTLAYFFLPALTFGIYGIVASISNLSFNPTKPSNIGYFKETSEKEKDKVEDKVEDEVVPKEEAIYSEAKTKMQRGSGYNTARFYKEAIELFNQIIDYKDSAACIKECEAKIDILKK